MQSTALAAGLVIGLVLGASVVVAILALPSVMSKTTVTTTSTATFTTTQTTPEGVSTSTILRESTMTVTSTASETSTQTATTIVVTTPPTVTTTTTTTTTEFTSSGSIAKLTVLGTISVPGGSGPGVLILDVKNPADLPIKLISVSNVTPDVSLSGNNGPGILFYYNLMPISMVNPLPVGSTTSATADTSGAMAGQTYALTLYVIFNDNSALYVTVNVVAQV